MSVVKFIFYVTAQLIFVELDTEKKYEKVAHSF
jgi:hypothetical protein